MKAVGLRRVAASACLACALGVLGLIPLPSKWHIEFGEPIETEGYGPEAAEDPMLVFELTDRVREQIQGSLYRLLMHRRSVWR